MNNHVKILAILNIVCGCIGLIGALVILLIFGGIIGVIGIAGQSQPEMPLAASIIGLIGGFLILLALITSLPAIIAGIGLLRGASWARVLTLVLSAFHLFNVPFGTALGIYGFWVLLSGKSAPSPTRAQTPIHL